MRLEEGSFLNHSSIFCCKVVSLPTITVGTPRHTASTAGLPSDVTTHLHLCNHSPKSPVIHSHPSGKDSLFNALIIKFILYIGCGFTTIGTIICVKLSIHFDNSSTEASASIVKAIKTTRGLSLFLLIENC